MDCKQVHSTIEFILGSQDKHYGASIEYKIIFQQSESEFRDWTRCISNRFIPILRNPSSVFQQSTYNRLYGLHVLPNM